MKSKKSKLITSGVASPIPTGRKDCGERRDRQMLGEPLEGLFLDTHGKERPWRERPLEGFELSQRLAFPHTPRTIRRCCSRPLLRRGRRAPRIRGQVALAFPDTPRTIWRCCSKPLLRRGRRAPRIRGQVALVFETPHGRYGAVRQASPWAWALTRDLIPRG